MFLSSERKFLSIILGWRIALSRMRSQWVDRTVRCQTLNVRQSREMRSSDVHAIDRRIRAVQGGPVQRSREKTCCAWLRRTLFRLAIAVLDSAGGWQLNRRVYGRVVAGRRAADPSNRKLGTRIRQTLSRRQAVATRRTGSEDGQGDRISCFNFGGVLQYVPSNTPQWLNFFPVAAPGNQEDCRLHLRQKLSQIFWIPVEHFQERHLRRSGIAYRPRSGNGPKNAHIAVEYSMRVAAFHKHPGTWPSALTSKLHR